MDNNIQDTETFKLSDDIARQLLAEAHDGIVVTDPNLPDNPLVYVNDAFLSLTGYSREETLGKNCRFLQADDKSQKNITKLRHAIDDQSPTVVDLVNYRKDGTKFYNELSVSPIFDEEGKLMYFLGVQKDVTFEVERNVARDDFVSLVSHQLKSAPNAINWSTEVLEDTGLTDEQANIVTDIKQIGQNMTDTINTLLNITRIHLGTYISEPQPVIIAQTLAGLTKDLAETIDKKGLSVDTAIDPDLSIVVDPSMFRIILETLLSNAVKYTPDGGSITAHAEKVAEEMVEISVTDTGIGIPKEEQDQLFKKMYRASNVQEMVGTGLGLYTLKIAVTALGGTVDFESVVGQGTTFRVRLPMVGNPHQGTSHLEFYQS